MKLFGTDGVRGEANVVLTAQLAYELGRAGAYVLLRDGLPDKEPAVVIGKDTRASGDMLEAGLMAGLCSAGVHVYQAGVVPTPAVAVLTRLLNCMAGVVISASHNPYQDNGIKFFSPLGTKLPDRMEQAIEEVIADGMREVPSPTGDGIGRVIPYAAGVSRYSRFINSKVDGDLSGLRVVVDCANGAASNIAPRLLQALGADVTPICCAPDGININAGCGSTHLEQLQRAVLAHGADVGVAYDGDADRLLAVDEVGQVVDGDRLLLIFAAWLQEQGLLAEDTVVVTVMSNMGLRRALAGHGIRTLETKVGDRYVIEGMAESGAVLGGEQSGHIVFGLDHTTGDGILSSVKLLQILKARRRPLSELAGEMEQYPQVLLNVRVREKRGWEEKSEIQEAIRAAEQRLGEEGRVLVRASGTENLLRVMVEGRDRGRIEQLAKEIAAVVERVMNGGGAS